ncbi:MAG TPA: hypothetical protein VIW92_10870 [Thermoanaerobaculia bacterium]
MKSRITLALAVIALNFGIVNLASAVQTPKWCQDICATVRCAYPTTCGVYTDANGQTACGCH